jgi:hypothetical protein
MSDEEAHIPHRNNNNNNFPKNNDEEMTPRDNPPTWEAEVQATSSSISREFSKGTRYKITGVLKDQMVRVNSVRVQGSRN